MCEYIYIYTYVYIYIYTFVVVDVAVDFEFYFVVVVVDGGGFVVCSLLLHVCTRVHALQERPILKPLPKRAGPPCCLRP